MAGGGEGRRGMAGSQIGDGRGQEGQMAVARGWWGQGAGVPDGWHPGARLGREAVGGQMETARGRWGWRKDGVGGALGRIPDRDGVSDGGFGLSGMGFQAGDGIPDTGGVPDM